MIHDLAECNPISVLVFKWSYSIDELISLYTYKTKKYVYTTTQHYSFLLELAKAIHGGGKDGNVGQVSNDDIKDLPDEKKQKLQQMLGSDYGKITSK